jgi:hypothetical protein
VQPIEELRNFLVADIEGFTIPREHWHRVRANPGRTVTFIVVPRGGRSAENQQAVQIVALVFLVIAAVVTTVLTAGAAGGFWAAALPYIAAGAFAIGTGLNIYASMALAPVAELSDNSGKESNQYTISGARNEARGWAAIGSLLGKFRFAPRFAANPYIEVAEGATYLHFILAVSIGLVDDLEIEIGETPITSFNEVDLEFRRGWHLSQITDRGSWNSASGAFPSSPVFGDHYTVVGSGAVSGVSYSAGQTITRNYKGDGTLPDGWDVDQFKQSKLYTSDVASEVFDAVLTTSYTQRTSEPEADELVLFLNFPLGLVNIKKNNQEKRSFSIEFQLRYAEAGRNTTQTSGEYSDLGLVAGSVSSQTVSGNQVVAFTLSSPATMEVGREYAASLGIGSGKFHVIPLVTRPGQSSTFFLRTPLPIGGTLTPAVGNTIVIGEWSIKNFIVTGRQTSPLIWSEKLVPVVLATSRQYDIGLKRITEVQTDDRTSDDSKWVGLNTVTHTNPVPINGIAYLFGRIRASEQLYGNLDTIFITTQRIVQHWNGTAWVWGPSSNPAAAFRQIMQEPLAAPRARMPDSKLDLIRLQEWSELCDVAGCEFNAYLDSKTSVQEVLALVAAAGRGSYNWRDGRHGVVYDFPQASPVVVVSPVNAYGFKYSLVYPELPHAYRLSFRDRDKGWQVNEEVLVYADGYNEQTAQDIERLELIGIDSVTQAMKQARYALANRYLRRELYEFQQGIEYLLYERGDRVRYQHDTLAIGLVAGRVIGRTLSVDESRVTSFVLDTSLVMEAGISYRVQVRSSELPVLEMDVDTTPGDTNVFNVSGTTNGLRPNVGDLILVGERGSESVDLVITKIIPNAGDFSAKVTAVIYRTDLYDWENQLPSYIPVVRPARQLASPEILGVSSGTGAMILAPDGTLQARIIFQLRPPSHAGTSLTILYRQTGTSTDFQMATLDSRTENQAIVTGLESGEQYDFRLIYTHPDYFQSVATRLDGHTVVGALEPPTALTGLTLSVAGGRAELRWDAPPELDVQFGGTIVFRHSPLFGGVTWQAATGIGTSPIAGSATHTVLPLKPGTYLGTVFDRSGNASPVVTISTKQASLLTFTLLREVVEEPAFSGAKVGMRVENSVLLLDSGSIDDLDWDSIPDFDIAGERAVVSVGAYNFATGMDFTQIRNVRLTGFLLAEAYAVYDFIDDPEEDYFDSGGLIDGDLVGTPTEAWLEYRESDNLVDVNNPNEIVWSSWRRLDSAEVSAWKLEFRLLVKSFDSSIGCQVSNLSVKAEVL